MSGETRPSSRLVPHLTWIGPLVIVAVTAAAWSFLPVEDWIRTFVSAIEALGPLGILAFAAVYIVGTLVLAPASAMSIAAGLAFGAWGIPFVLVVATTAAGVAFLLARTVARAPFESLIARRPLFQAIARAIDEEGWRVVGLVRLSPPIPFAVTNYLFGVTNVGFWPFVLTTAVAILPATLVYVNIGMLGHAVSTGGSIAAWQWVLLAVGIAAGIAAGWLVGHKAGIKLKEAGEAGAG